MAELLICAKLSAAERNFRSRIAQLASSQWFLRGTLSDRSSKYGKPNCHCAKGELHQSVYLVQSHAGKLRQLRVPKAWQDQCAKPLVTTRRCNAWWKKSPNWNGNVSRKGSPDILRRLIAYSEK